MRARGYAVGEKPNHLQHWEEADTKEELLKLVIDRLVWNAAVATALTRKLLPELGFDPQHGTWQETHDYHVQRRHGNLVVPFTIEFDDGTTEQHDINMSSEAVTNSGIAAELRML